MKLLTPFAALLAAFALTVAPVGVSTAVAFSPECDGESCDGDETLSYVLEDDADASDAEYTIDDDADESEEEFTIDDTEEEEESEAYVLDEGDDDSSDESFQLEDEEEEEGEV